MRRRPDPAPKDALQPGHPHYNPDPHAHPGLHIIALIEAVKGVLAVIAASGLALLGPAPLQRWIHILIARFQLDPEHGALALFAEKISRGAVHWAAAAVMAYGILHVIEAWGLWRARAWRQPIIPCEAIPAGGQFSSFIPSDRPRWASTSLISVSDFLPRFGVLSSSTSVFWIRSPM